MLEPGEAAQTLEAHTHSPISAVSSWIFRERYTSIACGRMLVTYLQWLEVLAPPWPAQTEGSPASAAGRGHEFCHTLIGS
jgi:hypothetical protein